MHIAYVLFFSIAFVRKKVNKIRKREKENQRTQIRKINMRKYGHNEINVIL